MKLEMNMNELWIRTCNNTVPSSRISPLGRIISKIIFFSMWRLILDFCFTSQRNSIVFSCYWAFFFFLQTNNFRTHPTRDARPKHCRREAIRTILYQWNSATAFPVALIVVCHVRSVSLSLCNDKTIPTYFSSVYRRKWGPSFDWRDDSS